MLRQSNKLQTAKDYLTSGLAYYKQGKYGEAIGDYTQTLFLIASKPRESWHEKPLNNLKSIVEYKEKILNYIFSSPSSHELVKSILYGARQHLSQLNQGNISTGTQPLLSICIQ